ASCHYVRSRIVLGHALTITVVYTLSLHDALPICGHEQGELLGALHQQLVGAAEDLGPFACGDGRPPGLDASGGLDRGVGVGGAAVGDGGDGLPGGGVDHGEGLPVGGVAPRAVDVDAGAEGGDDVGDGAGHGCLLGSGVGSGSRSSNRCRPIREPVRGSAPARCSTWVAHEKPSVSTGASGSVRRAGARACSATAAVTTSWPAVNPKSPATPQQPVASRTDPTPSAVSVARWTRLPKVAYSWQWVWTVTRSGAAPPGQAGARPSAASRPRCSAADRMRAATRRAASALGVPASSRGRSSRRVEAQLGSTTT